jgi:phosphoribosyl 1,2-cyclic phosphate phosphodiesterase
VTAVIRELDLIVLGSGTSSGVPVIGCDCDTCTSDDPRDRRLRTSAAVRFRDAGGRERLLLIDASPDLREQALRHGIRRCDAILFTHNHVDHVWGLDETRRFNVLMDQPIEVHADHHTMESLFRVYQHIFRRETNVNDSFVASLLANVVDAGVPVDLHGLRCTPLRMLHGRLPVLAWRLEALDAAGAVASEQPGPLPLVWATDVSGIPPETWPGLEGLRTLFLDMLRERAHPTHFTVDEAIGVAERVAADRTWFIHMTHDIRHAELDPRLPDGMQLAWDGLVVD